MMLTRNGARVLPRSTLATLISAFALAATAFAFPALADAAAPAASITSGPAHGAVINDVQVSFAISSPADPFRQIDFLCTLDGEGDINPCDPDFYPLCTNETCTQTKNYPALPEGQHTFTVNTIACHPNCGDPGATFEFGPVVRIVFDIDRTAPVLTLYIGWSLTAPLLHGARTSFNFGTGEFAIFTCAIDTSPAVPCSGGLFSVVTPANGRHTLTVNAVDRAGNSAAPLVHPFLVDVFKPKKCKKGKSAKAKAKFRKCKKSNATARAKWKKKHGLA